MSHFTIMNTKINDVPMLVKALADKGHKNVEIHEEAVHLYGFQGDQRPETAEIVIRRQHLGSASNDLGFKRQPNGNFQAIVSSYDRGRYNEKWLGELMQRYAYHVTRVRLVEQGFDLIEEKTTQDGRIQLVGRRVV
jgi:hypothetical protein